MKALEQWNMEYCQRRSYVQDFSSSEINTNVCLAVFWAWKARPTNSLREKMEKNSHPLLMDLTLDR